ncbi:unnamed protein product, partial [Prorocentrum cordatum]
VVVIYPESAERDQCAQESEPKGIGLNGTSGHSNVRRARFTLTAFGSFASMFIVVFAKDLYILSFGASADSVGAIVAVLSILLPVMYPLAGYLMDREPPMLSISGWGRRAPWFATHVVPLSIVMGAIFLPGLVWLPPAGSWLLDVWLGSCMLVAGWCIAVQITAYESARAEIYPFKGERVLVEGMSKVTGACAAIVGIGTQFVLWAISTVPVRLVVSFLLFASVNVSLVAVPVLRDARQPRDPARAGSIQESIDILRNAPMRHAVGLRFWQTAAETASANFSIYYLTFVNGQTNSERAVTMATCGAIVALLEFGVLIPFWSFVWMQLFPGQRARRDWAPVCGGARRPCGRPACASSCSPPSRRPPC